MQPWSIQDTIGAFLIVSYLVGVWYAWRQP